MIGQPFPVRAPFPESTSVPNAVWACQFSAQRDCVKTEMPVGRARRHRYCLAEDSPAPKGHQQVAVGERSHCAAAKFPFRESEPTDTVTNNPEPRRGASEVEEKLKE